LSEARRRGTMALMAYLAVAYPEIADADRAWIDAYRERHDHRYAQIVPPHFTLIFPVPDWNQERFVGEVAMRLKGWRKINFRLAVATVSRDNSGAYFHDFLIPEEGFSAIVKLHDALYGGALSDYLRLDLDFIPHVGIGNDDDGWASKARVDEINAAGVSISGVIKSIDVIEYTSGPVRTVRTFPLG